MLCYTNLLERVIMARIEENGTGTELYIDGEFVASWTIICLNDRQKGVLSNMLPELLAWFRPGFHPWDTGMPEKVAAWLAEYETHGDPMQASEIIYGPTPRSAQLNDAA